MVKFNIIGAAIFATLIGLGWGWYTSVKRDTDDWGEGMYVWVIIFAVAAFAAGGFLIGSFQKENYEPFENETEEEYKKRMQRIERKY
jgi:hypothetical protein